MWSSFTEKATKGLTDALEKSSQALNEAEKQATKHFTEALEKTRLTQKSTEVKSGECQDNDGEEEGQATSRTAQLNVPGINQETVLKNLQMGWSSVVETTKRTMEVTKEVVDTERARIEENFSLRKKGFVKRDARLPLDAEALRDAEVTYLTDRIISMSHPAMASKVFPMITAERKLAAVSHLLGRRHEGRFLIYNLSEVEYDTSILDDQVLTFSFPGSPSPPLGLLLKLLISMENWMKADKRNVAVVHCLTGKGRSSMVLASFLCWMGEAGFGNMNDALAYIARCKQLQPQELTIPSQRRYASYFKNILDGVRPSQPPLLLKRIILSEAPRFAKGPPREDVGVEQKGQDSSQSDEQILGCAPYLQVFKAGKLIFTTAATLGPNQSDEDLPFVRVCDGTIPFDIKAVIHGDILIRCRHLTRENQRVSMFRAAFHTGYVPPNVLRLTKTQLDGACSDERYPDDIFLDLIFEKVDAETATKHLEEQEEQVEGTESGAGDESTKAPVIKASSFDTMLNGDSRVWDLISSRKKEHAKRKNEDPLWGPTVGRRRGENQKKEGQNDVKDTKGAVDSKHAQFSIGNEFDFLPMESAASKESVATPPEKDSLMEALNALDHDESAEVSNENSTETEEIVDDKAADSEASEEGSDFDGTSASAPTKDTESSSVGASDSGENPSKTLLETVDKGGIAVTEDDDLEDDDLGDMDALLASVDDDFGDVDLAGFDEDDDLGLDDLENMLKT